jgi:hypothetical protein
MKLIKSKKAIVLLAMSIVAIVAAVGAYAYFTSTGDGTGSASVGTTANDVTVSGSVDALPGAGYGVNLYPGGDPVQIDFTASNPENFNQKISTITLASVDAPEGCDTTVFHMSDVAVADDGNLAPNATGAPLSETGTLYMDDNNAIQDDCQDGSLTLHFTTS